MNTRQELKTPQEWMEELYPSKVIIDEEGWHGGNSRPYDEPISREEFEERLEYSTVRSRFR
jgi:hypothetical protein